MTHPTVLCKAEGIWFAYHPKQWILRDINLEISADSFLAIIGPSGAGKTTLIKILAGLLKPQRGEIELLGCSMTNGHSTQPDFRRQIGYIPQQLGLVRGMTALENVLVGALGRITSPWPFLGMFPKSEVERAREYLALLGIAHKAHEPVFQLSGGERQRVAIARTLLQNPKIVFADEFVSDLDLPRAAQVLAAMRELGQREKIPFIINLHDIPLVQELGHQVIVLKAGTIIHQGNARDITMAMAQGMLA